MKKAGYHKQDWFIALLVSALFGVGMLGHSRLLERIELLAYDVGVRATHRTTGATDHIAIVAIDDRSIEEIGRWPWPRNVLAETLDRLSKAEPRAIAVLLDLSEPQVNPGLSSIRDIRDKLADINVPKQAGRQFGAVRALLNQAEKQLDTDRALARAMAPAPRLHLPMHVEIGAPTDDTDAKAPEIIRRQRLTRVVAAAQATGAPLPIAHLRAPLDQFARHARGIGHLSFRVDADGAVRALRTALEYQNDYYPSLALLLAASHMNLDGRHIELGVGSGTKLGNVFTPTDAAAQAYIGFYTPTPGQDRAFSVYSLQDVRSDAVPASRFTNKIVLLGLTASGLGTSYPTPISAGFFKNAPKLTLSRLTGQETPAASRTDGARMSEPELTANAIASILNQDFYSRPAWVSWAEPAVAFAVLLYLTLALPRMNGKVAVLVSLLLLIGLIGAEQFLMVTQKQWLQTGSAALLLMVGHLAIGTKRFVLGERGKADTDSAHTNRMLGLALQSQGQLDMALDKFRKLPVDESVLDLIYNLALDFERKRQFLKAAAAYDYILDHRRSFRDCAERKKRATQADQGLALNKTMILDGAAKPTLGRYHIERELGRGEMGVVYLGLDPKINRRVAIKTMALSAEMEAKELGNLRERFLREAETAGRLHHPNIVTIYDVGEEHDLAYIAMEYLEGKELATYIDPDKPLAFDWILDVAIKVADALTYAHAKDVVHRDIKPSNIVYHEASGSVKVMDFGIARIIAANRTKTGLVLGTPSYMSPEQITGKRVDGRSDLYAFGSMLFEMVTGDTPYDGDTFASLMHQIINAPAPDIRKLRPDTPPHLAAIIKRLLQKQVTKRYQTGEELKRDLQQCRSSLGEAVAKS